MQKFFKRLKSSPSLFWLTLAFSLRILFALKLGNGFYQRDESGFHAIAWNIASWGTFGNGKQALAGAPIPAFFLSIFFFLFGDHPLYARLGLLIPGVFLVWIIGKMTEDISGSKLAGKIALAIAAVYPFFIYYGSLMMSETPYLLFMTWGLWRLCQNIVKNEKSAGRAVAAGVLLALAGLSRPEGVVIFLGIWAFLFLLSRRNNALLKSLGLSFFCWGLVLFSWSARNRVETGSWALDSHGGISLLHGTLLFDLNEQDTEVAMQYLRRTPLFAKASRLPPQDQDRLYWKTALSFMLSHPQETFRQWGRKTINFWRFYPRTDKLYAETKLSQANIGLGRKILVFISLLFEPWLIIFGLWGLFQLRLRKQEALNPIFLFILGTFCVHVVSVSQMRYRLPVMPFLILGFASLLSARFQSENR